MPKRKTRRIDVMLSSTSKDLPDHRDKATNAILRAGMTPIIMETLTATSGDPITDSLSLVDKSDVYIGIFGMRYGDRPKDSRNPNDLSITEMEYRHAVEKGKVVLCWVMADNHPGPKTVADGQLFYEQDPIGQAKLKALKDELWKHTLDFFTSPDDLSGHIIQSLLTDPAVIALKESEDESDAGDASLLPEPPAFYADPPYTLTSQFIGRSAELAQLDAWAQSGERIMLIEAIGGMGKSAVTWEWVQSRALPTHHYDGVMWWSFYESGATMSAFLRHALAYLTRGDPEALKGGDAREHLRLLQRKLREGRYLLVLDGLERVLVAYHRWNAAQMRDDTVEAAESIIKDRDIRACTDPKDDEVLKALLSCAPSQFLISSRLLPLALEDRTGTLSKGVAHIHLNGLHPTDALALTRQAGVKVKDERQFAEFVKTFGGHSLLVKLMAGRINKFKRARGDFDIWHKIERRQLRLKDYNLKQNQNHILEYAFDGLDTEARRFLSQIAAYGIAVQYEALSIFNPYVRLAPEEVQKLDLRFEEFMLSQSQSKNEKRKLQQQIANTKSRYASYLTRAKTDYATYKRSGEDHKALSQFDDLLSDLEERGLLRWDAVEERYDMHPVVRGIAYDRLEADIRSQTFANIQRYFESKVEDIDAAQDVSDLINTIGVYQSLIGANKWDEAVEFFSRHLYLKLYYNIAAYYKIIELIAPVFPNGLDSLPALHNRSLQSVAATALISIFEHIGRFDDAMSLNEPLFRIDIELDNASGLITDILHHATIMSRMNQPVLADRMHETALLLAQITDDKEHIEYIMIQLLISYTHSGRWSELDNLYGVLQANMPKLDFWKADVYRFYAQSLFYRGLPVESVLNTVERLASDSENKLVSRQINGLRGEIALREGDYKNAEYWFKERITASRQDGSIDEYNALGGLARTYALQGNHELAIDLVDTGVPPIDAAQVYQIIGDNDLAEELALLVYEYAWADGPPYVWWWELERAKKVLDALGVPYPDLPPFDESKVGKYPYQDEIEAYIERKRRDNA